MECYVSNQVQYSNLGASFLVLVNHILFSWVLEMSQITLL